MPDFKKQSRGKNIAENVNIGKQKYILRLFITGVMLNSINAIRNINKICELYLKENYELEIIDIYHHPEIAKIEQIIIIPVLIVKYPKPERRLVGDLSNSEKVLEILNINLP